MQAITVHAAHDLRIEDFAVTAAVRDPGEVRARISARGICGSELDPVIGCYPSRWRAC